MFFKLTAPKMQFLAKRTLKMTILTSCGVYSMNHLNSIAILYTNQVVINFFLHELIYKILKSLLLNTKKVMLRLHVRA